MEYLVFTLDDIHIPIDGGFLDILNTATTGTVSVTDSTPAPPGATGVPVRRARFTVPREKQTPHPHLSDSRVIRVLDG